MMPDSRSPSNVERVECEMERWRRWGARRAAMERIDTVQSPYPYTVSSSSMPRIGSQPVAWRRVMYPSSSLQLRDIPISSPSILVTRASRGPLYSHSFHLLTASSRSSASPSSSKSLSSRMIAMVWWMSIPSCTRTAGMVGGTAIGLGWV